MPNWCQNKATIRFKSSKHAKEFILACREVRGGKIVPGTLLDETQPMNLFQYYRPAPEPCQDWYSWRVTNWGTKWSPTIVEIQYVSDDTVTIDFETAWGPALAFFEYCNAIHGWCWEMHYIELGMAFAGDCAADKSGVLYHEEYGEGSEGFIAVAEAMGINLDSYYDENDS